MFNPDPSKKTANPKLSKEVIMMIEKNNLVMAIKTLAEDKNISIEEAKVQIDAYETTLKVKQQQNLNTIANNQGISNHAISFDREQNTAKNTEQKTTDDDAETEHNEGFKSLQEGFNKELNDLGYKKPLLPYWLKRLLIIAVISVGLFWIIWRVFG